MLHLLPKTVYIDNESAFEKDYRIITNIFTRISLNKSVGADRWNAVERYHIKDGQRPEDIAEDKYGNVAYWWVIFAVNPQIRSRADWPMSDAQIDEWARVNLGNRIFDNTSNGSIDLDAPFSTRDGILVDYASFSPDDQRDSTTIHQLLREENDKKRIINILTPELIPEFVDEYRRSIDKFKNEI